MSKEQRITPTSKRFTITALSIIILATVAIAAFAVYTRSMGDRPAALATSAPTIANLPQPGVTVEQVPQVIPLTGPVARSEAELSGLAWYSDNLILLPQYPQRMSATRDKADGALFAIPKADILRFVQSQSTAPLVPRAIPLVTGGFEQDIPGFEGFEAIAFLGNRVFLTIEASQGSQMMGYLVSGSIAPDLSEIRLDPASLVKNQPQVNLENKSDEALLVWHGQVYTFYEANGAAVNPSPHATIFDPGAAGSPLRTVGTLPFPHIEYRITDAATPTSTGQFWAINYFFPDEDYLKAPQEPLALEFGEGPTHAKSDIVERLVQFQFTQQGILLTSKPPVQLQLLEDGSARNWEGLALLDELGFLIVTDKFPETILAFVATHP